MPRSAKWAFPGHILFKEQCQAKWSESRCLTNWLGKSTISNVPAQEGHLNMETLRDTILSTISLPQLPERIIIAEEVGIRANTGENQQSAIQQAIDQLSLQGGGILLIPKGIYDTGAIEMKSHVHLRLDSPETILRFIPDPALYPVRYAHWEATPCMNYSALLYACDAHDIVVSGPGHLYGGADREHWWNWHHQVENAWSSDDRDYQLEDRSLLRQMNAEGVPIEARVFGNGHYLRPNFIQFVRCERIMLSDFSLHDSPMWQINPVFCKSIVVDNVTLSSHGPNNDGCDPESCNGVVIRNCRFDTGDDCISLKSGRDLDGRRANTPCQNVLIEHNHFLDGHGGVALGSEMSGGISNVLADHNHFESPNLTYALRFKTNARRGGYIENVTLSNSEIAKVGGAALHGTMLYEDGRNGDYLPLFRNITVENITAHGGDYGIFLEAFPEVPITGLILRNIHIDGVRQTLHSLNWENPIIENVTINGKAYPRPVHVRIPDIPFPGAVIHGAAETDGTLGRLEWQWETSQDGIIWQRHGLWEAFTVPEDALYVRAVAMDPAGQLERSIPYLVLPRFTYPLRDRLACRGMLPVDSSPESSPVTRLQLARMLSPLGDPNISMVLPDSKESAAGIAVGNKFLSLAPDGKFHPEGHVTRQEFATVLMQACGINYRNASSTMPVCADVHEVTNNYGTNVARALYFGFLSLESGYFHPNREVTFLEAMEAINRVADFAGL